MLMRSFSMNRKAIAESLKKEEKEKGGDV